MSDLRVVPRVIEILPRHKGRPRGEHAGTWRRWFERELALVRRAGPQSDRREPRKAGRVGVRFDHDVEGAAGGIAAPVNGGAHHRVGARRKHRAAGHRHARPGREEFRALARDHTVVPVWREVLADYETPVSAFAKLVGDRDGFLLESVEHGERWSRFSFVGRNPRGTLTLRDGRLTTTGDIPASVPLDKGILAAMDELLRIYRAPLFPDLPPLQGGLMGHLGYDVIREVEHLPNVPRDDRNVPDAAISIIGSLAAFDHWRQRVYLLESVPVAGLSDDEVDAEYDAAVSRVHRAVEDLSKPLAYVAVEPPVPDDEVPEARSSMPNGEYRRAVEVAKEHIRAGDIFQVVLAQRYDVDLDADPFDVYRVLRQVNPSPYMYFLRHEACTVAGSSPEPMVQVFGRKVISRPIAGTRRRGRTDEDDRRMAAELRENPKEIAEHIMLVDLARNDVGRIAKFGTVHVDELMTLEKYSHVMHLTSEVSGELLDDRTAIDVLRATLPAGTVSGAPKVRAMEIIDSLEPVKRGPYAGVVGYVDFSGNLDTALAIRTMFAGPHGASFQAGAGVVADSVPDDEDLECRNKAAALLAQETAKQKIAAAKRDAEKQKALRKNPPPQLVEMPEPSGDIEVDSAADLDADPSDALQESPWHFTASVDSVFDRPWLLTPDDVKRGESSVAAGLAAGFLAEGVRGPGRGLGTEVAAASPWRRFLCPA